MAKYTEKDGRHVYKTQEEYRGVRWICKGTSYESDAMARAAWQRNKEKRIAKIDGQCDHKEGRIRISKALWDWYDMYKRGEVRQGRPRSSETIKTDTATISGIIYALKDPLLCDVNSDLIQHSLNQMQKDGKSQSLINKRWLMLCMFYQHICPDGVNDPMRRCKKPMSLKGKERYTTGDDEPIDKLAYTDTQIELLAQSLKSRDCIYSDAIIVILYQCLRIGEAIELRVKDVDIDRGVLHVRRQYHEDAHEVVPPKYGSRRSVPIMRECRDILSKLIDGKNSEDLLFPGSISDGHVSKSTIRYYLEDAIKTAELPRHTVHDLRHDGITRLVNKGVKPQSVSKWAGHQSLSFTLDRYYRQTAEDDPADLALVM